MAINLRLLSELERLLPQKRGKQWLCQKLSISESELEELLKVLKGEIDKDNEFCEEAVKGTKIAETEVNHKTGDKKVILQSEKPLSPKEIEELVGVDNISTFVDKSWLKSHKNGTWTYSILVTCKIKDYSLEDFTKFLSNWKPLRSLQSELKDLKWECIGITKGKLEHEIKEFVDVELNIADFHLAKKTIQGDTIETKTFDYYNTINQLISKIKKIYNINKLVFPISNDFFHSDNYSNSTTNLTPQDVTVTYNEEYEKGFELLANSISFLSTQAKEVEIILVQGNHDKTKGFFVAHALEVFFKGETNIKFKRNHSVTKSTVLGNTFIGYHHGNSCKLEELPLLFATGEYSKDFGNCKFKEVHTGDKHYYMAKEIKGIRIQQMPSLSGTDRWHLDNNYVHQLRAALALVYHPELGKIAEFEHRI